MFFPFAQSAPLPAKPPLVAPKTVHQSVSLDNASLPAHQRVVIQDPARKFCEDQFANIPAKKQLALLAEITMKHQELLSPGTKPPLLLAAIRKKLAVTSEAPISHDAAVNFFFSFPSNHLGLLLSHMISQPEIRTFVLEKFYDYLKTRLPAVAFTLAHIYSGGVYGLLTARGGRDREHQLQLETISHIFGQAPIAELTYYVNDSTLSKRFANRFSNTASRKAAVLTNFACGLKENEEGFVVPMSVGKRFDEIHFIDDEDKNLKQVLRCLIRAVCTHVFDEIGWVYRTPEMELLLNEKADILTEREFSKHNVTRAGDMAFWRSLVDTLLSEYTRHTGHYQDRDTLIADLIADKRWMPDVIKVYNGRTMSVEPSIAKLRAIFQENQPLLIGSAPSVVFNDIDRTILTVDAKFYVVNKLDPSAEPVLTFSQQQFAQQESRAYWTAKAAELSGIPEEHLDVAWPHFYDKGQIDVDCLLAPQGGKHTENVHNPELQSGCED